MTNTVTTIIKTNNKNNFKKYNNNNKYIKIGDEKL